MQASHDWFSFYFWLVFFLLLKKLITEHSEAKLKLFWITFYTQFKIAQEWSAVFVKDDDHLYFETITNKENFFVCILLIMGYLSCSRDCKGVIYKTLVSIRHIQDGAFQTNIPLFRKEKNLARQ